MTTRIRSRRGTAAAWTSANPVLAAGELGVETDTLKLKAGDGSTAWNALDYVVGEVDPAVVDASVEAFITENPPTVADDSITLAKLAPSVESAVQAIAGKADASTVSTLSGTVTTLSTTKLTKPSNPAGPAAVTLAVDGTVSTTLLSGLGGGPGAAQLTKRGDYTTAQADDPAFAVGDAFTWNGVNYLVVTAFTGTSTPDLAKTVETGPASANIVNLTQFGLYLTQFLKVDNTTLKKTVDGDGVITLSAVGPDDPSVTVEADPTSGDAPLEVTATATALDAAGDPVGGGTYAWVWGDGNTTPAGSSPTANHTYDEAGDFTITVTYTDTSARTATGETDVSVSEAGAVLYSSMYDADSLTGGGGTTVHELPDEGTAGRDLICRYLSDGAIVAGAFGSHKALSTGTRPYSQPARDDVIDAVTVILVAADINNDADTKLWPLVFVSNSSDTPLFAAAGFIGLARNSGVNSFYFYNGSNFTDSTVSIGSTGIMTGPHVVTVTIRTGSGMSTLHVDGDLIGSHSLVGVSGDYLGTGIVPDPSGNGDTQILHMRVYETALSDSARAAEEAAVAALKGITL